MLYPLFFAAVYLSHLTLLRLPYFWDEAGYYIPAAWDFFRTGTLIPSHHRHQRAPAAALDPARRLVAPLRLRPQRHAHLHLHGCRGRAARRLPAGARPARAPPPPSHHAAHRDLPHLVRAEHARPRRHLRRRLHPLGAVLLLRGYRMETPGAPPASRAGLGSRPNRPESMRPPSSSPSPRSPKRPPSSPPSRSPFGRRAPLLRRAERWPDTGAAPAWRWIAALSRCSSPVLPLSPGTPTTTTAPASSSATPEFLRYNATANLDAHRIVLCLYHRSCT
jgi:hypothetical protein